MPPKGETSLFIGLKRRGDLEVTRCVCCYVLCLHDCLGGDNIDLSLLCQVITESTSKAASREDLLEMRSKKKSDRYVLTACLQPAHPCITDFFFEIPIGTVIKT